MTDDLITWLRAIYDERERVARAAPGNHWIDSDDGWVMNEDMHLLEADPTAVAHIALNDPARVLAEVDAKRRILDLHGESGGTCRTCCGEPYIEETWDGEEERTTWNRADLPWPCPTVRLLALSYADWPGYRDEWKP